MGSGVSIRFCLVHTVGQLYCSFNVLGKRLSVKRRLVGFMCFKAESYTCTVFCDGFRLHVLDFARFFMVLGFRVYGFGI